jgi:hypothetical protein
MTLTSCNLPHQLAQTCLSSKEEEEERNKKKEEESKIYVVPSNYNPINNVLPKL